MEAVGLDRQTREYIDASRSDATRRAYASDWADFVAWCSQEQLGALPAAPGAVARYLADLAGKRKASTLQRRAASIAAAHRAASQPDPTKTEAVRAVLRGIRRVHGSAQTKKAPVRVSHLRVGLPEAGGGVQALRDRALLLLGYAGAFRRSELCGLNYEDIEQAPEGLVATVRRSKTDQEGRGLRKAIPYGAREDTCPARAVLAWMEASGPGPLFRPVSKKGKISPKRLGARSVALIVKRHAAAMGLDSSKVSAHSLRAGLVTDGFAAGVPEAVIMEQTGHRSHAVMAGYRREANLFRQNVAASVGL